MLGFRVLGPFEVVDGDRQVPLDARKERTLLAILVAQPGQAATTDRLIDLLWEGSPPDGAIGALRYHVSILRDRLEPERGRGDAHILVTRPGGYALALSPDQVDAHRFENLVEEAGRTTDPAASLDLLEQALGLWRGPAYAGFECEEFSQAERRRLEELRLEAEEDRMEAMVGLGRHEEALPTLDALTRRHPLREQLWAMLMIGLYRSGRQAEALRAFRQVRTVLADELGIEPSPDLCAIEERILLQDPSLDYIAETPNNLPAAMSSFIGRKAECERVLTLLTRHRLVTLTGPGGVGKSRLAFEVGRRLLSRFVDGVWIAELASLDDPALVPHKVASASGLTDHRGGSSPIDRLVGALRGRSVLLMLDNCEHLVDAVAVFAAGLLTRLPRLRILATSREPLRVEGEALCTVRSLSHPDPAEDLPAGELRRYESVDLFCDRATTASYDFRLTADNATDVARLCARLDGLPLSLELAATHTRMLAPGQILERLSSGAGILAAGTRGGPARHQSLESAIAWSYDTLKPAERFLFNRLAVFAGSFGLGACEAVCAGGPVDGAAVLTMLAGLVDKSLVATIGAGHDELRYRLLETIRHFARERLNECGETEAVRELHTTHFRQWALARGAPLHWPQDETEMEGWRIETDNLRAALAWALETGDGETALSICGAMWRFWDLEGASAEGLDWLERSLALAGPAPDLAVVVALRGAGALSSELGRLVEAQRYDMRGIELASGDDRHEVRLQLVSLLGNLGDKRMYLGDYPGAASLFDEALEIGSRIDHPHLGTLYLERGWNALCLDEVTVAHALFTGAPAEHDTFGPFNLWGQAVACWIEGDLAGARKNLDEYLSTTGDLLAAEADGRLVAALLARDEHRLDLALQDVAASLPLIQRIGGSHLGRPAMLAWWLLVAATVHADLGNCDLSARLAGAGGAALERSSWALPGFLRRDLDRHLEPIRSELAEGDFERAYQVGRSLTVDEACLQALRATRG